MIEKVHVRYFKRFEDEIFDLTDSLVLAGPNNSGKTTLLQAIAVWHLALRKWMAERGPKSGSKAQKRTGVPLSRKEFTAIPLRELNLLWTACSTALRKDELGEGQKLGVPRLLEISLEGTTSSVPWSLKFEFRYQSSELLYVKPTANIAQEEVFELLKDLRVVHVPPFSGIGAEETRYDRPFQDLLVGQGKPGDIVRNLLLEIYEDHFSGRWEQFCKQVEEIFGYKLLPPVYEGRPFIVCEYIATRHDRRSTEGSTRLDIASAGSGFLQVVMLLGFFYARPASILLLDEPDAHQHVVLQKQLYDKLREIARQQGCQLLIATHSEVLIDSTSPEKIISFFRTPHPLAGESDRDQVREALKRLTSLDVLLSEQSNGVLYVEGETDLDVLRELARVSGHEVLRFFNERVFWHSNQGRNPRVARDHFFALKAVKPQLKGLLLLDGDDRALSDHDLTADRLVLIRWKRYEIENYLVHPVALKRFVESLSTDLFSAGAVDRGMEFLRTELPPGLFTNPLEDHDYIVATPASKSILPKFFDATGFPITKPEYYQLAAAMRPEEIHPEVIEKLDQILGLFN